MHHVICGVSSSNPPQMTEAGRYTSQPHVIRGEDHGIHRKLHRPHVIRGSPRITFQIHQRKWEKFTKPIQAVGHLMVKEFYANAWEPDKARRKQHTYTSMVRGTEISFAPNNIKRVLKLRKDPIPNAPSYHERKENEDFRLDHILYDMCEEGAE
ncbi:hypothetical protein PIB30_101221 [Stylosanthes scabra]|uniref:Putative plant transposon protein domain-containing protein n=1 Tax=Stylosanthes scabra TaxID=79078 RepID=A0ABU6UWZ2_9FABA|nr:hypothetical protein [Stylosanthes scabra]